MKRKSEVEGEGEGGQGYGKVTKDGQHVKGGREEERERLSAVTVRFKLE